MGAIKGQRDIISCVGILFQARLVHELSSGKESMTHVSDEAALSSASPFHLHVEEHASPVARKSSLNSQRLAHSVLAGMKQKLNERERRVKPGLHSAAGSGSAQSASNGNWDISDGFEAGEAASA